MSYSKSELDELIQRGEAIVRGIHNRSDCGPHHFGSDVTNFLKRLQAQKTPFEMVGDFHRKFGLDTFDKIGESRMLDMKTFEFRYNFLVEELEELDAAQNSGDLAKAADALADLVYVALGTAHMMKLPFDEIFAEVQRANMTKERATGGDDPRSVRKNHLDVVKPAGWTPPRIQEVLDGQVG